MGKKTHAENLYGKFKTVYNLEKDEPENIVNAGLIINLHIGVKKLLEKNIDAYEFFKSKIKILKECVITGDEISSGVIPADSFERKWRDETGRIYQLLAFEADIVERVFAGLAVRLK